MGYNKYSTFDEMMEKQKIKFPLTQDNTYIEDGKTIYRPCSRHINIPTLKQLKSFASNDNHLYEHITKKIRRICFDFDIKTPISREEVNDFLNVVKQKLEKLLNTTINPNDFIVLVNEPKTKVSGNNGIYTPLFYSIHIIISSIKMDYRQQKQLAERMNVDLEHKIDIECFGETQSMRMMGQSKEEYGVKLVNFYKNILDLKDTLVDYSTKDTKTFKFIYDEEQDNFDNKEVVEIKEDEIIHYILEGNSNDICMFDRNKFFN